MARKEKREIDKIECTRIEAITATISTLAKAQIRSMQVKIGPSPHSPTQTNRIRKRENQITKVQIRLAQPDPVQDQIIPSLISVPNDSHFAPLHSLYFHKTTITSLWFLFDRFRQIIHHHRSWYFHQTKETRFTWLHTRRVNEMSREAIERFYIETCGQLWLKRGYQTVIRKKAVVAYRKEIGGGKQGFEEPHITFGGTHTHTT